MAQANLGGIPCSWLVFDQTNDFNTVNGPNGVNAVLASVSLPFRGLWFVEVHISTNAEDSIAPAGFAVKLVRVSAGAASRSLAGQYINNGSPFVWQGVVEALANNDSCDCQCATAQPAGNATYTTIAATFLGTRGS